MCNQNGLLLSHSKYNLALPKTKAKNSGMEQELIVLNQRSQEQKEMESLGGLKERALPAPGERKS